MRSFDDALKELRFYLKQGEKLERERLDTLNDPNLPGGLRDEQELEVKAQIDKNQGKIDRVLSELTRFPPFHDRHRALLKEFHKVAPFETSVFIMTKFPDLTSKKPVQAGEEEVKALDNGPVLETNGGSAVAQQPAPAAVASPPDIRLAEIIDDVKSAIHDCGYVPRIASEANYHPFLWDNVELHLLGCSRGVAIVEDRHSAELNPNVAMEWGWMVGMGRRVLYLVERGFKHARADWTGLIKAEFDWDGPPGQIQQAVHMFLGCQLKH